MPSWLVETTGARAGYSHPLDESTPLTVGRAPENAIMVQHAQASRQHVRFSHDGARWLVEDLGTKNGTLRNGRPLAGAEPLEEGDEIALPGLTLTFRATDETMIVAVPRGTSETSSTKSFLFADLRDYTSFAESHGDAAAGEVIAEYRRLVRAEVKRAGGREIKTEGDSFFVVFDSARRALDCAVGIRRAATEHTSKSPDRPIRVGIGLHAGEPVVQDNDYVGLAVNIAARLAQNARAGEILVSDVVRGLLRTSALPPMTRREGVTLKGIEDPPGVYVIAPEERSTA